MTSPGEIVPSPDLDRSEKQMENTIRRSAPCPECGAEMLWTQNAWPADGETRAAYCCVNGHAVDPSTTRQCPACGVHDTTLVDAAAGQQAFRCCRCGEEFRFPR
jgi:predicted  nucleic acid-binding Zn ribbon protein